MQGAQAGLAACARVGLMGVGEPQAKPVKAVKGCSGAAVGAVGGTA